MNIEQPVSLRLARPGPPIATALRSIFRTAPELPADLAACLPGGGSGPQTRGASERTRARR